MPIRITQEFLYEFIEDFRTSRQTAARAVDPVEFSARIRHVRGDDPRAAFDGLESVDCAFYRGYRDAYLYPYYGSESAGIFGFVVRVYSGAHRNRRAVRRGLCDGRRDLRRFVLLRRRIDY